MNSTTREGYKLDGWYTSGGAKWDEQGSWGVTPEYCDKGADAKPIYLSNAKRKFNYYTVTLTAHWTPDEPAQTDEPDGNKYTITFDSLGGTFADLDGSPSTTSLELESGAVVTAPAAPVKEHYDFAGWYPELPEVMPATDLTVTATWKPTVYHVGFFDGSKQLSVLDGIFGSEIKAPKDPVKEGSVFAGWNTKSDGTRETVTFPLYMRDVDLMSVYGNKCGKQFKMAKIAKLDKAKLVVKAVGGKKLAKGTYYKFIVVALDKAGKVVSTSKVVHVATAGKKKASNYKKVKVSKKVLAKAKKLKKGKSLKLKAKAVKKKVTKAKFHTKLRYESTNNAIATVTSKGVVKAKKKGTCFVYAYVQNGVSKKVKVVVK